jgi:PIN domain nuclease of toxin-antitoxin system
MKLLLDTHTFLWWATEPTKLSPQIHALCSDTKNDLFLSVASIWEMQIKQDLGKLILKTSLSKMVDEQKTKNSLLILSVQPDHVFGLSGLPTVHKDPFDRILIAQARFEDMILLSVDGVFKQYEVKVIW